VHPGNQAGEELSPGRPQHWTDSELRRHAAQVNPLLAGYDTDLKLEPTIASFVAGLASSRSLSGIS